MNRTRTRMLTFRVTEDEFERLQEASILTGSRCLSDFLRQCALDVLTLSANQRTEVPGQLLSKQILNFEERVRRLESRMSDLTGGNGHEGRE